MCEKSVLCFGCRWLVFCRMCAEERFAIWCRDYRKGRYLTRKLRRSTALVRFRGLYGKHGATLLKVLTIETELPRAIIVSRGGRSDLKSLKRFSVPVQFLHAGFLFSSKLVHIICWMDCKSLFRNKILSLVLSDTCIKSSLVAQSASGYTISVPLKFWVDEGMSETVSPIMTSIASAAITWFTTSLYAKNDSSLCFRF